MIEYFIDIHFTDFNTKNLNYRIEDFEGKNLIEKRRDAISKYVYHYNAIVSKLENKEPIFSDLDSTLSSPKDFVFDKNLAWSIDLYFITDEDIRYSLTEYESIEEFKDTIQVECYYLKSCNLQYSEQELINELVMFLDKTK